MARILVIEDNPTNLELMTYLLGAYGHEPITAYDAEQGLLSARGEMPDLILCDIQLPGGMDGYEYVRILKGDKTLRKIPVIAVTALAMVGDKDRVMAAGFDGYISKPIAPDTFVGQVESYFNKGARGGTQPLAYPSSRGDGGVHAASKGIVILVVDNMQANLDFARNTLKSAGYEIVTAKRIEEGMKLARERKPDLILSDLHIAKQGGYDFIREVKADPALRDTPFVFLSSTVWTDDDPVRGLALGAARFLLRPIEPQALLDEIKTCLELGGA